MQWISILVRQSTEMSKDTHIVRAKGPVKSLNHVILLHVVIAMPSSVVEPPSADELTRYYAALDAALEKYNTLQAKDAHWTLQSTHQGLTVHTAPVASRPHLPVVRGHLQLHNITPDEFYSAVRSEDCHAIWDSRYDSADIYAHIDQHTVLVHNKVKGQFPVAPRDMCLLVQTKRQESGKRLLNVAVSIQDQRIPVKKGFVRSELDVTVWDLVFLPDKNVLDVTYLVSVDLGGSIPSSLVRMGLRDTPTNIVRVADLVKAHGSPPLLTNVKGIKVEQEKYDVKQNLYHVKLVSSSTSDEERCAEILVFSHHPTWSHGYTLTTETSGVVVTRIRDDGVANALLKRNGFVFKLDQQVSCTVKIMPSKEKDGLVKVNGDPLRQPGDTLKTTSVPVLDTINTSTPSQNGARVNANKEKTSTRMSGISRLELPEAVDSVENGKTLTKTPTLSPIRDFTPSPIPISTSTSPLSPDSHSTRFTHPPKQHAHQYAIVRLRERVHELDHDVDGHGWVAWDGKKTRAAELSGIGVWVNTMVEKAIPAVRVDATFLSNGKRQCPKTEELAAMLLNSDCRAHWDRRFEDCTIVKELDSRTTLEHVRLRARGAAIARDLCLVRHVHSDHGPNGSLEILTTSVEDSDVPVRPERVRAELDLAAWIFRPMPNNAGVRITFIESFDPKGDMLPEEVQIAIARTAVCVPRLIAAMEEFLVPPYLARSTLKLVNQKYELPPARWYAQLSADSRKLVAGAEIRIPGFTGNRLSGYGGWDVMGWNIRIDPPTVDVVRIQGGFRVVARGGEKMVVTVQRGNGDGKVRVNGEERDVEGTDKAGEVASIRAKKEKERRSVVPSRPNSGYFSYGVSTNGVSTPTLDRVHSGGITRFPSPVTPAQAAQMVNTIDSVMSLGPSSESIANRGRIAHRRTVTAPSLPVKMIRAQNLNDRQVFFLAIVALIFFYAGLAYERFILNWLLEGWV